MRRTADQVYDDGYAHGWNPVWKFAGVILMVSEVDTVSFVVGFGTLNDWQRKLGGRSIYIRVLIVEAWKF